MEVAAMLQKYLFAIAVLIALPLFVVTLAFAAEGTPAPPIDGSERIAALVEQLEHAAFTERQVASQNLAEAGSLAFPQLEVIAASGNRESAGRALDIVKQHFQNGDAALKNEAR